MLDLRKILPRQSGNAEASCYQAHHVSYQVLRGVRTRCVFTLRIIRSPEDKALKTDEVGKISILAIWPKSTDPEHLGVRVRAVLDQMPYGLRWVWLTYTDARTVLRKRKFLNKLLKSIGRLS